MHRISDYFDTQAEDDDGSSPSEGNRGFSDEDEPHPLRRFPSGTYRAGRFGFETDNGSQRRPVFPFPKASRGVHRPGPARGDRTARQATLGEDGDGIHDELLRRGFEHPGGRGGGRIGGVPKRRKFSPLDFDISDDDTEPTSTPGGPVSAPAAVAFSSGNALQRAQGGRDALASSVRFADDGADSRQHGSSSAVDDAERPRGVSAGSTSESSSADVNGQRAPSNRPVKATASSWYLRAKNVFVTFSGISVVRPDIDDLTKEKLVEHFERLGFCSGLVARENHGEPGKFHFHVFAQADHVIATKDARYFDWHNIHPNIIPSVRSVAACLKYVKKDGDTLGFGGLEIPPEKKESAMAALGVAIRDHKDLVQVFEQHPAAITRAQGILGSKLAFNNIRSVNSKRQKPFRIYLHGKPGAGKTLATQLFAKQHNVQCLIIPACQRGSNLWVPAAYDPDVYPMVNFDNINEDYHLDYNMALQLLDEAACRSAPMKGSMTAWRPRVIFITSIYEPAALYSHNFDNQLDRRLDAVTNVSCLQNMKIINEEVVKVMSDPTYRVPNIRHLMVNFDPEQHKFLRINAEGDWNLNDKTPPPSPLPVD